jgi:hypothetical protein
MNSVLHINLCINQIQMLCNSTYCWYSVSVKGSSVPCQRSPAVVIFNSMIPQHRSLKKTSEIRASVIEDMKSRRAISYWLWPLCPRRSTLLVQCSSTTCKVSAIAVFSRWSQHDSLSLSPPHTHTHERPESSGQTSLVAAASQNVRFAHSLATLFQAGQPHLHTRVCPFKWV